MSWIQQKLLETIEPLLPKVALIIALAITALAGLLFGLCELLEKSISICPFWLSVSSVIFIIFTILFWIILVIIAAIKSFTYNKNNIPLSDRINNFWEVLSEIRLIDSPHFTNIEPGRGNEPIAQFVNFNGSLVKAVVTKSHDVFARIVHFLQGDPILMIFMSDNCKSFGLDKIINDPRFSEYLEYWHNEPKPGVLVRYSMDKLKIMMDNYMAFSEDLFKVFKTLYLNTSIKSNLIEIANRDSRV
jgi:hypothetical protein